MNLEWLQAPKPVQAQLEVMIEKLDTLLGRKKIGVYLHGSLALGDFNIEKSDIDLIVVVKNKLANHQKKCLANLMMEHSLNPSPIELSVLSQDQLQPWQHPCPFDFHYSESWRKRYKQGLVELEITSDGDLAGHIHVLNKRGLVLSGSPITSVFPEIPHEDYMDSVLDDLEWSMNSPAEQPVYAILNHCRTYAYLCEGKVLSKGEGGDWLLPRVPKDYHKLIGEAVAAYRFSTEFKRQESETKAFIEWIRKRIQIERGN